MCTGYGLTETSPTLHLVPVADGARKVGSIGVLLPHLQLRLVVDGEGDGLIDAKEGEPGELWVKGPSIMKVMFSSGNTLISRGASNCHPVGLPQQQGSDR